MSLTTSLLSTKRSILYWGVVCSFLIIGSSIYIVAIQPETSSGAEWGIPRWLPEDRFVVDYAIDPATGKPKIDPDSGERLGGIGTVYLNESFPYINEYGESTTAVEYSRGKSEFFVDLERGIGTGHVMGFFGGISLTLSPGFWLSEPALGAQGVWLEEGKTWTIPERWSGNKTDYEVIQIDENGAIIEVTHGPEIQPPYWPGLPNERVKSFEMHYSKEEPYPRVIKKAVHESGTTENLLERHLVDMDLAEGHRPADREPSHSGFRARQDIVRSDWHETLNPTGSISPRFDLDEIFAMARSDSDLSEFLADHPNADLMQMRYLSADNQDRPETAHGWNLTFVDPMTGDAYAFVRARFIESAPGPLPLIPGVDQCPEESVGSPINHTCRMEDEILLWGSGKFKIRYERHDHRIRYPLLDPIGDGLQMNPDEALRIRKAANPDAPDPVALGWSRIGDNEGRWGLVSDQVHFISFMTTWAFASGNLTYNDECHDGDPSTRCRLGHALAHDIISAGTGELLFLHFPAGSTGPWELPDR